MHLDDSYEDEEMQSILDVSSYQPQQDTIETARNRLSYSKKNLDSLLLERIILTMANDKILTSSFLHPFAE